MIGFVQGNGNSNSPKLYSFTDENVPEGKYRYRLKQIDTDGKFEYSHIVEIDLTNPPLEFVLEQNYPNPFNPGTTIKYSLAKDSFVSLIVYDVLGTEVAALVNEQQAAGNSEVSFDGKSVSGDLTTGIYIYRLGTGSFTSVKKMLFIK